MLCGTLEILSNDHAAIMLKQEGIRECHVYCSSDPYNPDDPKLPNMVYAGYFDKSKNFIPSGLVSFNNDNGEFGLGGNWWKK